MTTPRFALRPLAALLALPLLMPPALAAQAPTSLTIYNDGRTLVRWTVPLQLPRGGSTQVAVTGQAEPGSIFATDPDVMILSGAYDDGVDEMSVLRRAVGRRLTFRMGKDTTSALVLGVNPTRYQLADGSVTFAAPGIPQYPADLVTVEPRYTMQVQSGRARNGLPLGYFTGGAGWSAAYQVILGGATARVLGQAVVQPGPLRFTQAEIQLLAGQVNVAPVPMSPRQEGMFVARRAPAAADAMKVMPGEQKVGEFHLYTLPGTWSLEPGVVRTIALFDPAEAPVTKSFEISGTLPYWGGLGQSGEEEEVPVSVYYTVKRPRKTDLGDRPLPGGVVRLFQPDSAGRLQLIGEAGIDHSPAGEDLRLDAGAAFDLTARRVQAGFITRRDSLPGGGWRYSAVADYKVTITNAADTPATVDVLEQRGGEWSVLSSSVKAEKLSSTRTRFRVAVPAGGKTTLTYRVRVIW